MTTHLSARLAWHLDGWNGRICRDPAANTFCVGTDSFPRGLIRESRDLGWEKENAGRPCGPLGGIPPCVYSINAFGSEPITGYSDPPTWYPADERKTWEMPPATVCIWPFEEMYRDEVKRTGGGQTYDYDKRLAFAQEYFSRIEVARSLVFYYANYSNPLSEDDDRKYVVVGASRVKSLGKIRNYDNMSSEARTKYGGGFVWALDLTSSYPDEGLRLPYHAYLDEPDAIDRFALVPPNQRLFKYATRQFADDDALELIERLIESAGALKELGDTSENWDARLGWLNSVVAELWRGRGLFPGMPSVLEFLHAEKAITFFRREAEAGRERDAYDAVLAVLDRASTVDIGLDRSEVKAVQRRWAVLDDTERSLLSETLVRFAITGDQIEKILGQDRTSHGITASINDLHENPYLLSEQFVGDDADDSISFTKIDHGVLPSPELRGEAIGDIDDWRRLRGVAVERLKGQQADVFVAAQQLIHDINHRLSYYPEWKRHLFTERYLEVDREQMEEALVLRKEAGALWVYLRAAYDDERFVEATLRSLEQRALIELRTPLTSSHWTEYLRDTSSPLATMAGDDYAATIEGQAGVCAHIFRRPLCVIAGEAGTGKTTVVDALIKAIQRTEGAGSSFQLLAPTGKAAERLRERTGRRGETSTIHSFLAKRGWLNENMTVKRAGGRREDSISTYVVDESSMMSLELTAALFRAINWNTVRRLVLVGDPSQLPPIGRGRIFADVIDWLRPLEGVGELTINVRQMANRVLGRGTAILKLANAYVRTAAAADADVSGETAAVESILRRVQEGGDVDHDLRVKFWRGGEDLQEQLIDQLVSDITDDTGTALNEAKPWEFWRAAFAGNTKPEGYQVLTPYRGEEFGIECLNEQLQEAVHRRPPGDLLAIDGIALGDKVMQIRNRPPSNPIWAWCWSKRTSERIEVYNGELGFAAPHAFDSKKAGWSGFRPDRMQVKFSTKPDHAVGYGSDLGKTPEGKWMRSESVEDNLELAYAISIHKAQGSEFDRVYFVVPKHKRSLLSRELFYTGLTRAGRHCTLLIEEDISPLLSMRRLEQSRLLRINASLFSFRPIPDELRVLGDWYEEGRIHSTLADYMVRSKSEVIVANMLFDRDIPFRYEAPLYAPDGTFYLPDFTISWQGQEWYWEHLGRMDDEGYRNHWATKQAWYDQHFPGRLVTTSESGELTREAAAHIDAHFSPIGDGTVPGGRRGVR